MLALLNATGLASLLTALFAMRFRFWGAPRRLAFFFAFFFAVELGLAHWVLPPGAFGPEVGILCLSLTVVVWATSLGLRRFEKAAGEDAS